MTHPDSNPTLSPAMTPKAADPRVPELAWAKRLGIVPMVAADAAWWALWSSAETFSADGDKVSVGAQGYFNLEADRATGEVRTVILVSEDEYTLEQARTLAATIIATCDDIEGASSPPPVPPCPWWCDVHAGHAWDEFLSEEGTAYVRYHESVMVTEVGLVQEEIWTDGAITLAPLQVNVNLHSGMENLTPERAGALGEVLTGASKRALSIRDET